MPPSFTTVVLLRDLRLNYDPAALKPEPLRDGVRSYFRVLVISVILSDPVVCWVDSTCCLRKGENRLLRQVL